MSDENSSGGADPLDHEIPFGGRNAVYGIFAGITPSITIALFSFFGMGTIVVSMEFLVIWLVCTFVLLPISLFLDARYLRMITDWDGRPILWALLSMVPVINVVAVPMYLIMREGAQPLQSS